MKLKLLSALLFAMAMSPMSPMSGCAFAQAASSASAEPAGTTPAAQDDDATPVLVELFTSEGCNSCPPADKLLQQLDGMKTPWGQRIVALSEHVTYWNQLGWVDPFSQNQFTTRQNNYSDSFSLDEVYTPQVVVNGAQQALGSDKNAVLRAIEGERLPLPVGIEIVSYAANGPNLSVVFMLTGTLPARGVELYAALADDSRTEHVLRGENIGRTLTHVSVVRGLAMVPVKRAGEQRIVQVPVAADARAQPEAGRRLVLFATKNSQGRVLGIASRAVAIEFPTVKPKPATGGGHTLKAR